MNRKEISFLIGAGFSKPAGFPLAKDIGGKFRELKTTDFTINTDQAALFYETELDGVNSKIELKKLAIEMINKYLGEDNASKGLDYEDFYDWFNDIIDNRNFSDDIRHRVTNIYNDCDISDNLVADQLMNVDRIYNQFIEYILMDSDSKLDDNSLSLSYGKFKNYIKYFINNDSDYIVHLHTLNHDLLMERIFYTLLRGESIDDGFSDLGSPYIYRDYDHAEMSGRAIKLPYYQNCFNSNIRLYKLHGSINHITDDRFVIKTYKGMNFTDYVYKEEMNRCKLEYQNIRGNYHPQYLTGKKYKVNMYNKTEYNKDMIKYIKCNIEKSSLLVVVGYSFGDDAINDMLARYCPPNCKSIIIDISQPPTSKQFLPEAVFMPCGISCFDLDRLLSLV